VTQGSHQKISTFRDMQKSLPFAERERERERERGREGGVLITVTHTLPF
jgi:hypothetical protein